MSKACLVLDMPESCMGCNFMYCDIENNEESCQAKETARPVDLEKEAKPDWCPLVPLPKKRKTVGKEIENDILLYRGGWNSCIDAIAGGNSD